MYTLIGVSAYLVSSELHDGVAILVDTLKFEPYLVDMLLFQVSFQPDADAYF